MDTEEHRHQCETRDWIRRRIAMGSGPSARAWMREVLEEIAKKRGAPAAERLSRDIADQWQKGSRGEPGDWR